MRRFEFQRDKDGTGFSGTGTVLQGVEFDNGQVALIWLGRYESIVIWPSINDAITVHGHEGDTRLVWID